MNIKPEKPKKRIVVRQTATFDFNWVSKKVSIGAFLAWVRDTTPPGAKDVTLELREEFYYDDGSVWLELAWDQEIDNPNYERELKKYEKKLTRWKKNNVKC